jgi:hypothetical protein
LDVYTRIYVHAYYTYIIHTYILHACSDIHEAEDF